MNSALILIHSQEESVILRNPDPPLYPEGSPTMSTPFQQMEYSMGGSVREPACEISHDGMISSRVFRVHDSPYFVIRCDEVDVYPRQVYYQWVRVNDSTRALFAVTSTV